MAVCDWVISVAPLLFALQVCSTSDPPRAPLAPLAPQKHKRKRIEHWEDHSKITGGCVLADHNDGFDQRRGAKLSCRYTGPLRNFNDGRMATFFRLLTLLRVRKKTQLPREHQYLGRVRGNSLIFWLVVGRELEQKVL